MGLRPVVCCVQLCSICLSIISAIALFSEGGYSLSCAVLKLGALLVVVFVCCGCIPI